MSDITKQIRDNFETLIDTTLGADWSVLQNRYQLDQNNFANQDKRFGVTIGSGTGALTVTKHYTVDRSFEVTLLQKYYRALNNDDPIADAIDVLEDALDEIAKASINQKAGTPNIVLDLTIDSIDEPDFESIENIVTIVATFNIKYRNRLS